MNVQFENNSQSMDICCSPDASAIAAMAPSVTAKEDNALFFPGPPSPPVVLRQGKDLYDCISRLFDLWFKETRVSSSSYSFNETRANTHPASTRVTLDYAFKTMMDFEMIPDSGIYYALCLLKSLLEKTGLTINAFNARPLFFTAVCIAAKNLLDKSFGAINFDHIGGFVPRSVFHWEWTFLEGLGWECEVSDADLMDAITFLSFI